MTKVKLIAKRNMMVGGLACQAGDAIEAMPDEARFLIARGWAEEAPAKKPAAKKAKKG